MEKPTCAGYLECPFLKLRHYDDPPEASTITILTPGDDLAPRMCDPFHMKGANESGSKTIR